MSDVAPDGSPVEAYRLLPHLGEIDLIADWLPQGAPVLELGCGAGRLTAVLLEKGHPVTAVDESQGMLAAAAERAPGATFIRARIQDLDLVTRFEVVLAASHLLNERTLRPGLLSTARRHLVAGGCLLAEVYPEDIDWPAQAGIVTTTGPVSTTLLDARVVGRRLIATARYALGGRTWDQPFVADLLDEEDLRAALTDAGLRFDGWIAHDRGWLIASAEEPHGAG